MFKKLLTLTLACSMLLISAQLISNEPAAQNCADMAKAQEALDAAQSAKWSAEYAKTEAQAAKNYSKNFSDAVARCAIAVGSIGVLALTATYGQFYKYMPEATSQDQIRLIFNHIVSTAGLAVGLGGSLDSFIRPLPQTDSYYEANTRTINSISQMLGLYGIVGSGVIMGKKF